MAIKEVLAEVMKKAMETVSETTKSATDIKASAKGKGLDVDKRMDVKKSGLRETKGKGFDPDKRMEKNKRTLDSGKEKRFDPDRRIDINRVIEKKLSEYKQELKKYSECRDTLNLKDLKVSDMKKVTGEKLAEMRREYKANRKNLIAEWEKVNGREWPTYKEDVLNKNGEIIRKKGDLYDAHHKKPLSLGGTNVVENITPLAKNAHELIHNSSSAGSSLQKLIR
jgi:hypothetical protein